MATQRDILTHCCTHCYTHLTHALCALHVPHTRTTPGRLTAAGDQGPTTLCTNSEEGADSPHSSDATELGPIGGELRVRNREPLAPSQHSYCAVHASTALLACTVSHLRPANTLHRTAPLYSSPAQR